MSQVGFSRNRCWDRVWCVRFLLETIICGKEMKEVEFLGKSVKLSCRLITTALQRALEQKWPSEWYQVGLKWLGLCLWPRSVSGRGSPRKSMHLAKSAHGWRGKQDVVTLAYLPSIWEQALCLSFCKSVSCTYRIMNEWEDSSDQNAVIVML